MVAWVDVLRFGWGYSISDQCGSFPSDLERYGGLTRGKPELLTGRTMRERERGLFHAAKNIFLAPHFKL